MDVCTLTKLIFSALLKMGDYYWYGCSGNRNAKLAATYYTEAAKKNDPQVSLDNSKILLNFIAYNHDLLLSLSDSKILLLGLYITYRLCSIWD